MIGNSPSWYMTTQEFADQVVQLLEDQDYFKKDYPVHPDDIVSAFTSTAESFARGVCVAGRSIDKEKGILQK